MMGQISELVPWFGALLATLFSWGMTALGAAAVFCVTKDAGKWMDGFLAFGGGVMLAASIWSLLLPAIEQSGWLIPSLGVLSGGIVIQMAEHALDVSNLLKKDPSRKRSFLLVLAVTLHNIPEGMAIGLAFALGRGAAPWLLALGIALQNFPEGAAVSLPLRREGYSKWKCFLCGQASGFVEPLAALGAIILSESLYHSLHYFLSFAAGAMLAVVVGDLLPEAVDHDKNAAVRGFLLGFLLMMILDVALG